MLFSFVHIAERIFSNTKGHFFNQYNLQTNTRQFTQMLFGFLVNNFSTKLIDKSYILWYYKDKEKYVNAVKEVKP